MKATVSILILLLVSADVCAGANAKDPSAILDSYQMSSDSGFIILAGVLPEMLSTDGWQIVVNDQVVQLLDAQHGGVGTSLRIVIPVRDGDNVISIQSLRYSNHFPASVLQSWSKHIFREPDATGRQFAVLIDSSSKQNEGTNTTAFPTALTQHGLASTDIFVVKSMTELAITLGSLEQQAARNDRLLIYFRGPGTRAVNTGEPILILSRADDATRDSLSISQLLMLVPDLPRLSLLFDVDFDREQVWPEVDNFAWFQKLAVRNTFELALSNPMIGGTPSGDITNSLMSQMESSPAEPFCSVVADAFDSILSSRANTAAAPKYIYLTSPTFSWGCIVHSSRNSRILEVASKRAGPVDPYFVEDFTATIPPGLLYSWSEIRVDGVLVSHRSVVLDGLQRGGVLEEHISVSQSRHLVEIRVGSGKNILGVGRTEVVPSTSTATLLLSSDDPNLRAEIVQSSNYPDRTTNSLINLIFRAGDVRGRTVQYELRNNGEVLRQGTAPSDAKIPVISEFLQQIPLSVGLNTLVVEVREGNTIAWSTLSVVRVIDPPLHALLIGSAKIRGSEPLTGVPPDIKAMKDILIRYTNINPQDIIVLTGEHATLSAIRQAMDNSRATPPIDPFLQGEGDPALFLYFSGYGTTLLDTSSNPYERCILPSDFVSERAPLTCLSIPEMYALLNTWRASVAFFDTSFDGLSGRLGRGSPNKALGLSRTIGDLFTDDSDMRAVSQLERPGRILIFASGTNTAALESTEGLGGVFTQSFAEALNRELAFENPGVQTLQLEDAFSLAKQKTILKSEETQTPSLVGFLPAPFLFSVRHYGNVFHEAYVIELASRADIQGLRRVNPTQLQKAAVLYELTGTLMPNEEMGKEGLAQVLIYQDMLPEAEEIISQGISSSGAPDRKGTDLAKWLLLRSQLRMEQGEIEKALEDCKRASSLTSAATVPSELVALNLMGLMGLNLATGHFEESSTLSTQLLNNIMPFSNFTEDEKAHIILLKYVSDQMAGHHSAAPIELEKFLYLQAPWFQMTANYFLNPVAEKSELQFFIIRGAPEGIADPKALDCMRHFYIGMRSLWEGSTADASQELSLVLATGQKQYVEYWIAKAQLTALQH